MALPFIFWIRGSSHMPSSANEVKQMLRTAMILIMRFMV
jgi:hypothetical protein